MTSVLHGNTPLYCPVVPVLTKSQVSGATIRCRPVLSTEYWLIISALSNTVNMLYCSLQCCQFTKITSTCPASIVSREVKCGIHQLEVWEGTSLV